MINVIRSDVYLYSTNNLFPYLLKFVNYFQITRNQYMLFWLLKGSSGIWSDKSIKYEKKPL